MKTASPDSNPPSSPTRAIRPFGLTSAICLVVANMIGAGVFTTSGFSLASLDDRRYVLVAWLIGGIIAICGAISYGQLARRLTESGGEYLFLSRLVHPAVGFLAGWVSLLAGFTGAIAFAATAFETYILPDSLQPDWYRTGMVASGAIVACGLLHAYVLRTGLIAQNVVVGLKLVLLAAWIGWAMYVFPDRWQGWTAPTEPVPFSVLAIASTLVWISLSFSGFNAAVYVTGEVKRPEINVPRGLLWGTLIVTVIYLILNAIFLYAPLPEEIRGAKEVAAIAAHSLGGARLAWLVRAIVSLALISSVSSMIVAGPRVYAKMAQDGLFPRLFRASSQGDLDVPVHAIWLQALLAVILVWFSTLQSLLDYLGFTLSVSAALTVACLFWSGDRDRSTGVRWAYGFIAVVYVLATLTLAGLSAINRPQQWIAFAATLASGLLLYALVRWRQAKPG